MRCSVCLIVHIMFCSGATHKFFPFMSRLGELSFLGKLWTLPARYSLDRITANLSSLITVCLFASPFPCAEPELCWQVSSDSDWTPAAHSSVCPSLSSLLAPDHISRLRLRPGQCWCQWWAGSEDAGKSHTTTHLTAHPSQWQCHKQGWGEFFTN